MSIKLALIILDHSGVESFYCKDRLKFKIKDSSPYDIPGGSRNIWNIVTPFNGIFVNANEKLPDVALDVIFLVMDFTCDETYVKNLRIKYPKAIILGYIKERSPLYYTPKHRIDFFNQCNAVACPYGNGIKDHLQNIVNVPVFQFPYPYDIGGLRKKYLAQQKRDIIMIGCNPKRGYEQSEMFAKEIAKRYELMLIEKPDFAWHDWLTLLSSCKLCINLETKPEIGQVPIECAILGVEHIGGISDGAKELFPWSATNDLDALRPMVDGILLQKISYVDLALENVLKRHSYASAIENLNNILLEIRKTL
jgi:hypothetical protein